MGIRNSVSTGPLSIDSILTDVLAPQQLPSTVNSLGESEEGIKQSLLINQVDVGNETGNTVACGWGHGAPASDIKLYDWDGSDLNTIAVKPLGSVGASGALIIEAPFKFHAIKLTLGATANATAANVSYYNGTDYTVFPGLADSVAPAFVSSTVTHIVEPKQPLDWEQAAGKYRVSVEVDAAVQISAIECVRLVDWVDNVASGNALSKQFAGELPMPVGCNVFAYISEADANNWVQIDFSQGA